MADMEKEDKKPVRLTGIDELTPKLAGLRAKVEGFRTHLEQTGLGKLDISGLFKGGSVITPFVDGIKASAAFKGQLTEVNEAAKGVDVPSVPTRAAQTLNVFSRSMEQVSAAANTALQPAVATVTAGLQPLLIGFGSLLDDNPKLIEGLAAGAIAFSAMQTAVTGATQVFDLMNMVLKTHPIVLIATGIALAAGLIVANWKPISAFFAGLWQKISPVVMPMVEFFRTMFAFTPLGQIISNWTPLTGLFSAIWDLLRALSVPVMDVLHGLFDWSPREMIIAGWGAVTELFSGIWDSIKVPALVMYDTLRSLFDWFPLEEIKKRWEPITEWFSQWWDKLQGVVAPIKEFFAGGFGSLVTSVTGKVEGLTEAQEKTNVEGNGKFAPVFFGADTEQPQSLSVLPGNLPHKPSMQPGSLTQNSSALIQQSAANSRTQLEGGLTVRFENAPAGMRTDQPQTNQPALAFNSRIGYRTLSLGGSNELA
ncbi:phage tail protein [Pseudomonas sp. ANT_J28]|uniref:phage tail protein n=1 Tax=Pseudomonas sp. ANT_J28 TaxID=2597352 RepID=UPI0011F370C2|nr:phage tail protein [Pseudomonas sp. ANT_J28]KAA0983106.1 phage tail protein [Pseudomonas sp. ANT_J28]